MVGAINLSHTSVTFGGLIEIQNWKGLVKRITFSLSAIMLLAVACSSPSTPGPATDEAVTALTADQCDFFDVNGKVRICHATGSSKNPYTILNLSDNACINAHAHHAGDYVAVGDPTCHGGG